MRSFLKKGQLGRGLASCAIVLGLLCGPLAYTASAQGISVDQVIQMHKLGLPEAAILNAIKDASFNLSIKDLKKLKRAGVAKTVVDSMSSSGGGSAAPARDRAAT